MIQIDQSIFIKRDPAEVFAFVTDVNNSPKYQSGMQSAEWITDGPVGVGSTMKVVSRFLGKDIGATYPNDCCNIRSSTIDYAKSDITSISYWLLYQFIDRFL